MAKKYQKRRHIYIDKTNGCTYYRVVYKNNRKRFSNEKEAEEYLAKLILSEKEVDDEEKAKFTYKDGVESLLQFDKNERKISTYKKKKQMFEDIILPNFSKDKSVKDIDMADCTKFRNYLGSLDYSTLYKNDLLRTFKEVFNHVDENYDIDNRYARKLKKFSLTDEEKLAETEKVGDVWNPEEFGKFIEQVPGKTYKAFFILAITCWTRFGESLALQWKDYDGKNIHVYKSCMKVDKDIDPNSFKLTFVKTKNGNRHISLPEATCHMLNDLKLQQEKIPGFSNDWFIFNRWDNQRYYDGTIPEARTNLNRAFKSAINKSGVREIRIHDLRHSGATYAIINGEDIKAVSERLGHSDIEITLRVYHHAVDQTKNKVMERCGDFAKIYQE